MTLPMSKRRGRFEGRRSKKNPSVVVCSPFTLLSAAMLLAYILSTGSFRDLSRAYNFAASRVEVPLNASLGGPQTENLAFAEGILEDEEDDVEDIKSISEKVHRRHGRGQERRHERIANIHHRISRKHEHHPESAAQTDGDNSTGAAVQANTNDSTRGQAVGTDSEATAARVEVIPPVTGNASISTSKQSSEAKPKEEAPKGARTSGKLPEFRGSLGGTKDGMLRGQNITRVSYTIYKIMKLFGFSSMIDSPAGSHAEWMPDVVRRMAYDVPFFQYVGVDGDGEKLALAKKGVGEAVDGEFYEMDVERELPNGTEVLFHWTELDGSERDARNKEYVRHVARVMRTAKKRDCGYIVLGQFPRLNGPSPAYRHGRWKFVGTEDEEPFLFNEHVRGVVPTAGGGKAYMLYLTFYSLKGIPATALDALL